ncbi:hypothetical protein BDZ89DRAFT_478963 [Hymenopellis radicata]|nr:hypothetical protein BDZ89DRAFT_478963 [Hymenopellis radicata]
MSALFYTIGQSSSSHQSIGVQGGTASRSSTSSASGSPPSGRKLELLNYDLAYLAPYHEVDNSMARVELQELIRLETEQGGQSSNDEGKGRSKAEHTRVQDGRRLVANRLCSLYSLCDWPPLFLTPSPKSTGASYLPFADLDFSPIETRFD